MTNQDLQLHLDDEQFADCAMGLPVCAFASEHLSRCAICSGKLALFSVSVKDFSGAALGWSESRSPMSLRQHMRRAHVPAQRSKFVVASWALAASLALFVGGSAVHCWHGSGPSSATNVAPSETDTATEIAQDNELMHDVNMAIGQGEPSPVREYGLVSSSGSRIRSGVESGNQ